jgi:hypothetical protein
VVLVFAGLPGSSVPRPVRRLVGFRRVAVDPGGRSTIDIPFDLATVAVRRDGAWDQEPGTYVVDVGTDAGPPVASVEVVLAAST